MNAALAFTLWNQALQVLSAVESSVTNNTMLIQIALLIWVSLNETLTTLDVVGLGIAVVGALLAQIAGQ